MGEEHFGIVQDLLWDVQGEEPKLGKRRDQSGLGSHERGKIEGKEYESGCVLPAYLLVYQTGVYVPPGDKCSALQLKLGTKL